MENFVFPYFTDQQRWIITKRYEGVSYATICREWPFKEIDETTKVGANLRKKDESILYNKSIVMCIKRSSLGYAWSKSMQGGTDAYLCPEDLNQLKEQICSAANDGSPFDTSIVIDKAFALKKARYLQAIDFINLVHAETLIDEIREKYEMERPPVRSWINGILEDIMCSIKTTRYIDVLRFIASTPENINQYFDLAQEIITKFHPYLIFGADETMLFPSMKRRVIIPVTMKHEFIAAKVTLPHFSAMCCHNMFGRAFTPFIILPNLKKLPDDLREFSDRGDVIFTSTKSGWQTRETFLFWTISFINELSEYRKNLPVAISDLDALLIVDGHSSRENAYALQLLKEANVQVLTLPAHTSHILQMFDVALAAPLKRIFSDVFNDGLKKLDAGNISAKYRRLAIVSFLVAWHSTCNYKNCQAAAKVTGTYPCNRNVPLASHFVKELNPLYQERAKSHQRYVCSNLNINGKVINEDQALNDINQYLVDNAAPMYCLVQETKAYEDVLTYVVSIEENSSKMLSPFPKYIDADGKVQKLFI